MQKLYYVYIMASKVRGTLYIGVTSNLPVRVEQHKTSQTPSFTQKYQVHQLVYYEEFNNPEDAITREKRLKKCNRIWKISLIENANPDWQELHI